jgi:hypothetical protein
MAISRNLIAAAGGIMLLATMTIPAAALLLALQRGPVVAQAPALNNTEIASIEQLLIDSAPGDVRNAQRRKLNLTNKELNLLLRYATELFGSDSGINGKIYLPGQTLRTEISVPVSTFIRPMWLNLRADFFSSGDRLQLASLKLGHLGIPGNLIEQLAARVEERFLGDVPAYIEILALLDSVQRIDIAEDQLSLDFMWEPSLIAQFRNQAQQLLISDSDQLRIARHHENLTHIISDIPESTRAIALSSLLGPMFASALTQSQPGDDPVAENRTLLLALAAYVNEEDISGWLREDLANRLTRPKLIEVRVQRRQDLAQHIVASAAIAASAGAGVAQVISNIKENYDARYRTGFSFSDLTANTAGVAMGSLATESRAMALEMQHRLSMLESDADYLPTLDGNRDGLSESDFNALYRQQNSSGYQDRVKEIETLVYQQPLFKGLAPDR